MIRSIDRHGTLRDRHTRVGKEDERIYRAELCPCEGGVSLDTETCMFSKVGARAFWQDERMCRAELSSCACSVSRLTRKIY